MSRVANSPVALPKGVDIKIEGTHLSVKGGKGALDLTLTDGVGVNVEDDVATITYDGDNSRAMAGTTRSLLANMVKGVSEAGLITTAQPAAKAGAIFRVPIAAG